MTFPRRVVARPAPRPFLRESALDISIIIPVYNGGTSLPVALAAAAACVPPAREIIVVDDASTDASAGLAEAAGARVLRLSRQGGPARARNRGAEVAAADVLLFVDADVALHPDATAQVLDAFVCAPEIDAVFGSYDDSPAAPNLVSQYKNLLHHWVHQTSDENSSTFWAGCGAVRRQVFDAVGGFDEAYARPSIEDIELGMRLRRAGHAIRLRKSLQAKHLKRWTPASLLRADIRDRALPWTRLLLRQKSMPNDLNLRWSARVCGLAATLLLVSLILGWRWHAAWAVAAASGALLLLLNAPLYAFFLRRGVAFGAGAILWHWFYYLYSTASFALGAGLELRRRLAGEDSQRRTPEPQP